MVNAVPLEVAGAVVAGAPLEVAAGDVVIVVPLEVAAGGVVAAADPLDLTAGGVVDVDPLEVAVLVEAVAAAAAARVTFRLPTQAAGPSITATVVDTGEDLLPLAPDEGEVDALILPFPFTVVVSAVAAFTVADFIAAEAFEIVQVGFDVEEAVLAVSVVLVLSEREVRSPVEMDFSFKDEFS